MAALSLPVSDLQAGRWRHEMHRHSAGGRAAVTVTVAVLVVLGAGAGIARAAGAFGPHGSSGTGQARRRRRRSRWSGRTCRRQTPVTATLGYAGSYTVRGQGGGTLTWLPSPGQVIGQGQVLYQVDNGNPVVLLYGPVPAWRTLR